MCIWLSDETCHLSFLLTHCSLAGLKHFLKLNRMNLIEALNPRSFDLPGTIARLLLPWAGERSILQDKCNAREHLGLSVFFFSVIPPQLSLFFSFKCN